MSNRNTTAGTTGGIGVAGALGILFIALKLTGVVAWSWLWVLAPFWIPLAIALGFFLVGAILLGIVAVIENRKRA